MLLLLGTEFVIERLQDTAVIGGNIATAAGLDHPAQGVADAFQLTQFSFNLGELLLGNALHFATGLGFRVDANGQ